MLKQTRYVMLLASEHLRRIVRFTLQNSLAQCVQVCLYKQEYAVLLLLTRIFGKMIQMAILESDH